MIVKVLLSRFAVIAARRELSRLRRGPLNTRSVGGPNDILTFPRGSSIAACAKRVDICLEYYFPSKSKSS